MNSPEKLPLRSPGELQSLVEGSEDLVGKVYAHLRAAGITAESDELLAFGRQGLIEAATRFDASRGEDFRRFAYFRVRGAMLDGLRKMGSWSRRGYERVVLLRAASEAAAASAAEAGSVEGLASQEAAARLRNHMASMVTAMTTGVFADHVAQKNGEVTALDSTQNAEEQLARHQLAARVQQVMKELPPPEDDVIRRFYLRGECMDDIAAVHGFSRSWVSRIHSRALKRMGARLRSSA